MRLHFDIATSYGFANYMFMTHEGPSFEAHQFIFGGSSAPVFPGDDYYQWFVSELPGNGITNDGCPAYGTSGWPLWVDPDGGRRDRLPGSSGGWEGRGEGEAACSG